MNSFHIECVLLYLPKRSYQTVKICMHYLFLSPQLEHLDLLLSTGVYRTSDIVANNRTLFKVLLFCVGRDIYVYAGVETLRVVVVGVFFVKCIWKRLLRVDCLSEEIILYCI